MEESTILQVRTGNTLHTAGSILTRDISLTHSLRRDFFPQIEIRRPLPTLADNYISPRIDLLLLDMF